MVATSCTQIKLRDAAATQGWIFYSVNISTNYKCFLKALKDKYEETFVHTWTLHIICWSTPHHPNLDIFPKLVRTLAVTKTRAPVKMTHLDLNIQKYDEY